MSDLGGMRCVVLGGGGFIGTNLCRALQGEVEYVRAFGRRMSYPTALKDINWIPGDFTDISAVASAVAGCDVVYHLVTGSTPASSNVDKVADVKANIIPTLQLLETCREVGVRRVVFVSSGGTIYGIPKVLPTVENAPLDPITSYGITKLTIEKYLALYEHLYGLQFRVLRVANPYGPYQTAIRNQGVVAAFIRRVLEGRPIEIWGDGNVTRDYVYIDDVVAALKLAAAHEGKGRIFNVGSGQGITLNEILSHLGHLMGKTIDVRYSEARQLDVPASVLDISYTREELEWSPSTPFAVGLKETLSWHLREEIEGGRGVSDVSK